MSCVNKFTKNIITFLNCNLVIYNMQYLKRIFVKVMLAKHRNLVIQKRYLSMREFCLTEVSAPLGLLETLIYELSC